MVALDKGRIWNSAKLVQKLARGIEVQIRYCSIAHLTAIFFHELHFESLIYSVTVLQPLTNHYCT